jgi:biopolymer transport protein ExbD
LADETILVGGSPIGERGIADMLREFKAAQPEGEVELRIRSDRAAPYRAVEPLLLECARNGIWKVTFAVLREPTR